MLLLWLVVAVSLLLLVMPAVTIVGGVAGLLLTVVITVGDE